MCFVRDQIVNLILSFQVLRKELACFSLSTTAGRAQITIKPHCDI